MITYKEYLEKFTDLALPSEENNEYYKTFCKKQILNYLSLFEGEMNKYSSEEIYNWGVTFETIFGIKTEREGYPIAPKGQKVGAGFVI